jgi:hypothetical protein
MSGGPRPAVHPRPSGVDRERAADRLRKACAEDRLSVQTFAARLELAYSARTEAELARLFSDLPEPRLFNRLVFAAAKSVSRWTDQLVEAWREPRTRRLALTTHDDVVLGRSRMCDCVIGEPRVSRRHARLRYRDGSWWLVDLGSSNGTFVNGWRVWDETEVRPGDEISFGDARFILAAP